jgi:hypothetical protein
MWYKLFVLNSMFVRHGSVQELDVQAPQDAPLPTASACLNTSCIIFKVPGYEAGYL